MSDTTSTITSTHAPQPVANNNNYNRNNNRGNNDLKDMIRDGFNNQNISLTALNGKVDTINTRINSLESRVDKLEDKPASPNTSNSTIDSMLPIALLLRLFG